MDKQKQIEEMAKVILPVVKSFYVTCTDKACDRCIIKRWRGECAAETRSVKIANTYYNAGYRKIPENAVVLTREEYEQIQDKIELLREYESVSNSLIKSNELCRKLVEDKKELKQQLKQSRKEMLVSECQSEMKDTTTVDLPCKIGATVYLPWEYDGVSAVADLTVTHIILTREKSYVVTDFETDDNGYWEKYKGGQYNFDDFGKIIFTKESKAKQRLNEKI